ncbi:MAG: hypothetical protein ABWY81_07635, partial [Jiangellaceae bacterium]
RFPYSDEAPEIFDTTEDYADGSAVLQNTRSWEWMHPLWKTFGALRDTGLTVDHLGEHDELPWKIYPNLVSRGDGMFGAPDGKWLPLALTLVASKPNGDRR